MGNAQQTLSSKAPVLIRDLVVKEVYDESSKGYIKCEFMQNNLNMILEYEHPNYPALVNKLRKNQAYRIRYRRKTWTTGIDVEHYQDYIDDITDVQPIKITGTIVDYFPRKNIIANDSSHAEVFLTQRPLKIPGHDCCAILLIDRKRIPAISKGVPYEFTVSLFRGVNEFLIGEINKAPSA